MSVLLILKVQKLMVRKVMSHSMCEGYFVFQFQNLDSKVLVVLFLFLLLVNYCVVLFVYSPEAISGKLSSYLPICTYNTGHQHLHLGVFLSSVTYTPTPTCLHSANASFHLSVCLSIFVSINIFLSSTHCSINPSKYIHYPLYANIFPPYYSHFFNVLCIQESVLTLICAVTFNSFTHLLIFPSICSSIHPATFTSSHYPFILLSLPTNASLRVFHPHIFPDRQTDIYPPIHHTMNHASPEH